MRGLRFGNNCIAFLLVLLLVCSQATAQTVSGTITGTVLDPSGRLIAGATVTLTNDLTGDTRTTAANEAGAFTFTAIPPAAYSIKVEQSGFKTFERKGMVLSANERLSTGEIRLSIGAVTETVSVTAQGAAVQTTSTEHSSLLTSNQIDMIQVKGRDWTGLLKLSPGVTYRSDSDTVGGSYGSSSPNIQGARAQFNALAVDGLEGNDVGDAPVLSQVVNMDAIGEIKILLNNYQAEYGRNGAAMINIVTKSGTKEFHGTGYWYKRHEMFNANDFFNNRNNVPKPRYRYAAAGFTVGGPVYIPGKLNKNRDKAFFFYSYDNYMSRQPGSLVQYTMPGAAERAGDFSQSLDTNGKMIPITDPLSRLPFANNQIPASRIDKNGLALMNVLPMPNFFDRARSGGNYNYQFQEVLNRPRHQNLGRFDYLPTEKDRISIRLSAWYSDENGSAVAAGVSNWGLAKLHYTWTDNDAVVNYTRVFSPTVVNELNVAARHGVEKGPPDSQAELDKMVRSKIGFSIGQFYPGNNPLNVIPLASFGGRPGGPSISFDGRFPLRGADTVFDYGDNLSLTHGNHSFRFGIFAERVRNFEGERGTFAGNFNFGRDVNNPFESNDPYSNALLGNFQSYLESSSRYGTQGRQTTIEWFAQDTYKVMRKLTIDYGVRFSWYTPWLQNDRKASAFVLPRYDPAKIPTLYRPVLDSGRRMGVNPLTGEVVPAVMIGAFVPGSGDPANGNVVASDASYPPSFRDQQPVQIGPRLGLAYDVFGNGKTAIRTSAGMFYNTRPSGNMLWDLPTNPPVQFNPTIYYGNLSTFLNSTGVLFPSSTRGFERNAITPTIYNFMFGIQQDVGFATLVDVSYVGSLGRHLTQSQNINTVPYGAHFLPQNADPANPSAPLNDNFYRPYPGFTNITMNSNVSTSNYNALQVSVNRRFTKGLQFGLAYTWSKTMDFTDTDGGGVALYRPIRIWNYGKAGWDQTHNLVFNYTWDLPRASQLVQHPIVRHAFDNWQVSGITAFVSGQPSGVGFSTTDGADISGGGDGTRIVVTGKAQLAHGNRAFDRWFDPSVFQRPAKGTFGDAPKDVIRLPGFNNWDISLFKKIPVKSEARYFQLRWEMYNAFNHTQFSGVDTTARFDPQGNQVNSRFGQVTSTRQPRVMQASLRFNF